MTYVSVGAAELWVEQRGSGPDVLLIAGLGDDASCWAEQARALSDRYRITTFDNRGVGRSSALPGDYTIGDFANDAATLLTTLGISEAHVIGSSMGGVIAQQLVLERPQVVRSLVLHGTWCHTDRHFTEIVRGWQQLARSARTPREFFINVNVWFLKPRLYNDGTIYEWANDYETDPHRQTVEAFCLSANALLAHDTREHLYNINCPTLITVGSLDICTPERYARELKSLIANAKLHIFEDAGHMPYIEDPDKFTNRIREFLDDSTREEDQVE